MASSVTSYRAAWSIPGTDEWAQHSAKFTRNLLGSIEGDCSLVASKLPHFRKWASDHGVEWPTFCAERLGAPPAFLDKIEEGVSILRGKGHAGPITKADAVAAVAAQAVPAPSNKDTAAKRERDEHGRVKPGTSKSTKRTRGETIEYLADRIARDRPDILEAMREGHFSSVRAAARAAGIVKPRDRVSDLVRAVARLTSEERCAFDGALAAADRHAIGSALAKSTGEGPA